MLLDLLAYLGPTSYTYDPAGNRTSKTSVVNDVLYAYDGWGNVQSIAQSHDGAADAASPAVQYAYEDGADANGAAAYVRLGSVTYPDGRAVTYHYGTAGGTDDILSRVAAIEDGAATETYAQYAYMGASAIVSVNHPDVGATGLLLTYDPAGDNTLTGLDRFGRVIDQLWTEGETTVDGYAYTYDPAGNRTSRTNVGNGDFSEAYAYDGLDRLTGFVRNNAETQDWTLDALGNWTSNAVDGGTPQTRTFDAANQITGISGIGTVTPTYDEAGNMVSGPSPADSTVPQYYAYDAWNRLTGVYSDAEHTTPIETYVYDGQNHRVQQTIGADVTDSYYNADWQVVETFKGDNAEHPVETFIWDLRYIDTPVVRFYDAGADGTADNLLYYTTDANNNVTALIDATTGEAIERYVYNPYGQVTVLQGTIDKDGTPTTDWTAVTGNASTVSNSVLYCGYRFDGETGLYHVRNRMYDPALGRWIQRDPAGYVDGTSLYQYVNTRPTTSVDPLGLNTYEASLAVAMGSKLVYLPVTINGCDESQILKTRAAIVAAYKTLAGASEAMSARSGGTDVRLLDYFNWGEQFTGEAVGLPSRRRMVTPEEQMQDLNSDIKGKVDNVMQHMRDGTEYDCAGCRLLFGLALNSCQKNPRMVAGSGGRTSPTVILCDLFFTVEITPRDRAGTIIHELLHSYVGADDQINTVNVYVSKEIAGMPKYSRSIEPADSDADTFPSTVNHASTIEWFVMKWYSP